VPESDAINCSAGVRWLGNKTAATVDRSAHGTSI
jgi:hypothetical protein